MNPSENPRVFISHSSKDKKRFVLEFAKRLRSRGIDAWLDKWEMLIGDSLVDKIFEEGIKNCEKFIIIISKNSINSKWVKEELDVGVVSKIEKQTTILPIIIDDNIEIPTVLSATVWKKIPDLESYDNEFQEIVRSILGVTDKPPLGKLPKYAIPMETMGSLNEIDSLILKLSIEELFKSKYWPQLLSGQSMEKAWEEYEISESQVTDSLEFLSDEFYLNMSLTNAGHFRSSFQIDPQAIIEYGENYIEDFDKKVEMVISGIVNEDIRSSDKLGEKAGLEKIVVNALIETWKSLDYIKIVMNFTGDGVLKFQDISASGKRYFREFLNQ